MPLSPTSKNSASTITEKFSRGYTVDKEPVAITLSTEKGAEKLAKLYNKSGGIQADLDRYKRNITPQDLEELKKSVKFNELAHRTDDISKVAYRQFKILFDYLEQILNDKELEKKTGITSDIELEKKHFVTKRLLPDPIEQAKKGKGSTLWTEDEEKFNADLRKRENFKFIQDKIVHEPTENFLQPYHELSPQVKDLLSARQEQLDYYLSTQPHEKRRKTKHLFDKNNLGDLYHVPSKPQSSLTVSKGTTPAHEFIDHSFFKRYDTKDNYHDKFKSKAQSFLDQHDYGRIFYATHHGHD